MAFRNKKYKMLRRETLANRLSGVSNASVHRIQALVDIPRHGVKRGDLGGYVLNSMTLSQEGDCWIDGQAQALESVYISGNAYVGGNAVLDGQGNLKINVYGNAKVIDNVEITCWKTNKDKMKEEFTDHPTNLYEDFVASGNAKIHNLREGSGSAQVSGYAAIDRCTVISGESEISGNTKLLCQAKVLGASKVCDYATVGKNAILNDTIISGHGRALEGNTYVGETIPSPLDKISPKPKGKAASSPESTTVPESVAGVVLSATDRVRRDYDAVMADIASYESDIVKIIKYPVMTDSTNSCTLQMMLARKKAQRLSMEPASKEFNEAVEDLEAKFMVAESNARKIAASLLSEAEKKKTEKAKDLFRLALNEASTEQEKKVAFIQGFKQLEGVLDIPEVAVNTFRIKVGLKEIEGV